MALRSDLFKNDPVLEACRTSDASHITPGAVGNHVAKIQTALSTLDNVTIDPGELATKKYGPSTAAAVLAFKKKRSIINRSYQSQADNIVGKMTIQKMDDELFGGTGSHAAMIDEAFNQSRQSLRGVQRILQKLERDIVEVNRQEEPQKSVALAALLQAHARDILVLSKRLLVSADPLSREFRDALQKVQDLIRRNLAEPKTIVDHGSTGRCDPAIHGGIPFAATQRTDPNPRVSVCTPFFSSSRDLQRDVITHEYFHLLGLADRHVVTTNDALTNANTIAQVVAFLHDRFRQRNSDGNEPSIPPLPSP